MTGLTTAKLEYFAKRLKTMEKDLTDEINQSASQYYKDRSSEEFENIYNGINDDLFIAEQKKKQEMLKQVKYALLRIKNGVYGICAKTGKPIDIKRLEANPVAICNIPPQIMNRKYTQTFK